MIVKSGIPASSSPSTPITHRGPSLLLFPLLWIPRSQPRLAHLFTVHVSTCVTPLRSGLWPSLSIILTPCFLAPLSVVRPRLQLCKWCLFLPIGSEGPRKQEQVLAWFAPLSPQHGTRCQRRSMYSINAERMGSPVSWMPPGNPSIPLYLARPHASL